MKIKTTFCRKADLGLGIRVLLRCQQVDTLDAAAGIVAIQVGPHRTRRIDRSATARALVDDFLGHIGCLTASWSALMALQKACLAYWIKAHTAQNAQPARRHTSPTSPTL